MAATSRRRRSRLFFALALVFAAVVAGLTWWGIERIREEARTEAGPTAAEEKGDVVIATQDIPPRTEIKAEMVKQVKKTKADIPPAAARKVEHVIGKTTRQRIPKDDEVHFTKLFAQRAEAGLAFIVPEGKRAVSVSVNEIIGSGGLILPGDYVDIISVCRASLEGGSEPGPEAGTTITYGEVVKSTFALQAVEVLAVGQLVEFEEPPAGGVQQLGGQLVPGPEDEVPTVKPPAQPGARTVTFAVAPEEAQSLILYDELCDLRLALRRQDDRDTVSVAPRQLTFGTAE